MESTIAGDSSMRLETASGCPPHGMRSSQTSGTSGVRLVLLSIRSVGTVAANPHSSSDGAAQLEIDHGQVEGGLPRDFRRLVRILVLHGQLGQRDCPEARNGNHVPKDAAREESSHTIDQRTFDNLP